MPVVSEIPVTPMKIPAIIQPMVPKTRTTGKVLSTFARLWKAMLLVSACGTNHKITAPARCITAITFCEAKKRSTSIPSTNGERIDAIGPAEKASPISSDIS